jgi:hypothetical protein
MKRLGAVAVIAFELAACAPTVNGTEMGGVAQYYDLGPGPAIQATQTHCQKYGRTARPTQTDAHTGTLTFSCEKS